MHVVFRHDRDVVSKNPAGGVDPRRAAAWARRQGVFLLVIFSLHKQRKVTRSPKGRESPGFSCCCQSQSKCRAFARLRRASAPFFACAKKGGPKKAHPAYAPSARRAPGPLRCRDFSTIHPCIVEKRRASCTSPHAGSCPSAPSLRKGPGRAKAEATAKAKATAEATAKAKATPPQPSPCLRQREGARATATATATAAAVSAGLVPQAEDQAEQHELYGVVTTINRPQLSAALGKLIVDAEAGRDHPEAGHQPA